MNPSTLALPALYDAVAAEFNLSAPVAFTSSVETTGAGARLFQRAGGALTVDAETGNVWIGTLVSLTNTTPALAAPYVVSDWTCTAEESYGKTFEVGTYTVTAGALVAGVGDWAATAPSGAHATAHAYASQNDLNFPALGLLCRMARGTADWNTGDRILVSVSAGRAISVSYARAVPVYEAVYRAPIFRFGRREASKQTAAGPGRVVFQPGDEEGKMGTHAGAQLPGSNPRSLGTLLEAFTVFVWASDPTAPDDERAQYVAARQLYDDVYRALYLHGRAGGAQGAAFVLGDPQWLIDHAERFHGAEIKCVGVVQAKLPDSVETLAFGAALDLTTEIGV